MRLRHHFGSSTVKIQHNPLSQATESLVVCPGFHYNQTQHQLISEHTFNQKPEGLISSVALEWKPADTRTALDWMLPIPSRCVRARLPVDVLSRLPSAQYVGRWGHSMASGTLGHFPSEEQQCFDLWESSLSTTCVRSCFPDPAYVLVFFVLSCRLYQHGSAVMKIQQGRQKHILCHTANNGGKHVSDTAQVGHLWDKMPAMCRLCLSHIKSQ